MDNHIFRSAALGFNRQDVMEYIEKTQKEVESAAADLSRRLDEALEELAGLRRELEDRTDETERLSGELAESREQYAQEKARREELAGENARQSENMRTLTAERDRLDGEAAELRRQSDDVRREKEKLAQLELDAHRRERETLRGLLVCSACGEANRFDSLYCRNCGKPLSRGS